MNDPPLYNLPLKLWVVDSKSEQLIQKIVSTSIYFGFMHNVNNEWKEILPIRIGEGLVFLGGPNQIQTYKDGDEVTVKICNMHLFPIFVSVFADSGTEKMIKIYPSNASLRKIEAASTAINISELRDIPNTAPYIILTLGKCRAIPGKIPSIQTFKLYITNTNDLVENRHYEVLTRKIKVYNKLII